MTDKSKLGEKIARILYEKARHTSNLLYELLHRFVPEPDERYELWTTKWGDWGSLDKTFQKIYLLEADQILALISDIEEGFAKGIEHYRKLILPVRIAEAKREERERIIKWGTEPCPHWAGIGVEVIKRDCGLCWLALKEE